jgi:hypothetical protein
MSSTQRRLRSEVSGQISEFRDQALGAGYFGVPTFALPRNVAFSSTTSRGASTSPRKVQPASSSQRSVAKILPSIFPRNFTDFALTSPRTNPFSAMVSVPVESIEPSTSQSMTSSLRNLTVPWIETPLERKPGDCAAVDERLGCSGIGGTSDSGFRLENIAICLFRFLQFWLRVKLILFLDSNNRRPVSFKIRFDPRNPR